MADGRARPLCKKCGNRHLNFVACAAADTFEAERAEKAKRLQNLARPVFRPRENDWGNRYQRAGYQQIATGVAVQRRAPLHSLTTNRVNTDQDTRQLLADAAADLLGGGAA